MQRKTCFSKTEGSPWGVGGCTVLGGVHCLGILGARDNESQGLRLHRGSDGFYAADKVDPARTSLVRAHSGQLPGSSPGTT